MYTKHQVVSTKMSPFETTPLLGMSMSMSKTRKCRGLGTPVFAGLILLSIIVLVVKFFDAGEDVESYLKHERTEPWNWPSVSKSRLTYGTWQMSG